jgi:hypothetical protein
MPSDSLSMLEWDKSTKWAVAALVTLIAFVLILAFYGYVSGAWDVGTPGSTQ